jgi:hypothetical protein
VTVSSLYGYLFAILATVLPLFGQTAALRGHVVDESGAVIPGAKVTLSGPAGTIRTTTSINDGTYSFAGLTPGDYAIEASAPDLALSEPAKVSLGSRVTTLDLQLKVVLTGQNVTVQENAGPSIATDAASNASALVLRGNDLQALADDPDDLQADLQALAGPSAGPNGGAVYIDGFSGGQLPSKESIREIRINQNPFSPEYDKLGYGRIEIFTKPGSDKFRGTAFYNFGDSFWNSRDPFAERKAPFILKEYGGNISGPLGKRASFFLDVQRHSIDNGDIIHAIVLDPVSLGIINPFTDVFRTPQRRVIVSPRVDYQLNANNTLLFRYGFTRADIRDAGIGGLNLVSRGDHVHSIFHTAQITETAVIGTIVNEIRFQFFRVDESIIANSDMPAVQVLGALNGGGGTAGRSFNTENHYEFQNYTSIVRGAHAWRFGARLRGDTVDDISRANFAGTFTFAGGLAPKLDGNNQPVLDESGRPVLIPIESIERYRRTLLFQRLGFSPSDIRALGGGATQFRISSGTPGVSAGQLDVGAFVSDDWRVRPNLTLSLGLRFETQTNIHDWRDFAPRIGIAWAPGTRSGKGAPKTVIRAGFGIFYDRFGLANTITAQRYDGIVQQQYVISNPDFFPLIPRVASVGGIGSASTIEKVSSRLRAPYTMQSALSIERQLPFNTTIAVTYANSHGLHQLRSTDINAPLPGTGLFPFRTSSPIFLMESSGLYNQNQLITNVNSRVNKTVSLFGYYVFNRAMSNTDGLGTFPANPYDYSGDYGQASTDVRHRVSAGGSIELKWNFRLNPLFVLSSGPPFDITAGRDIFGDTLFNGRPGIATDPLKTGVIATKYGLLDPIPTPDEKILPRNFGRGPGSVMLNLRIGKTFTFGSSPESGTTGSGIPQPGGGGPDRRNNPGVFTTGGGGASSGAPAGRRYNLAISMAMRNILNHTNPGPITGNVTSPLFGRANQTAGATSLGGTNFLENANNRRLELQMRFTF